jgi:hypothetical protein
VFCSSLKLVEPEAGLRSGVRRLEQLRAGVASTTSEYDGMGHGQREPPNKPSADGRGQFLENASVFSPPDFSASLPLAGLSEAP